jgi:heme exporter protein C
VTAARARTEETMSGRSNVVLLIALVAVTVMMFAANWMVFVYAPEEKVMGAVQRIFYFHVPSAIVTYLSVFVLLAGALGYLWTRDARWDNLSIAATETGLLFCSIVLITGPIWAKPAWGVWWTWEARLTTTLLLWIILAAAMMVRGYAENRDLGARMGAVLGIFAAIDIFFIKKAVEWWRGQHPIVFKPGEESSLDPKMRATFLFCIACLFLLYGVILALRYRQAELDDRVERLAGGIARQREVEGSAG